MVSFVVTLEDIVRCADSVNAFFPGETFFGAVGFFELHPNVNNDIVFLFLKDYYKWNRETDLIEKIDMPYVVNTDDFHVAVNFKSLFKQYDSIIDLMEAEEIPNEIVSMEMDQDNREITIHTTTKVIGCHRENNIWYVK